MACDTVLTVGKSTLVERLAEKLSACRLQSPPEEIRHLRAAFDSKAGVARRAFYYLGNYLLAHRIRQLVKRQTVVLDRYKPITLYDTPVTEVDHYCIALTSSNLGRFSKFFYRWKDLNFQQNLYDTSHRTFKVLLHCLLNFHFPTCSNIVKL